MDISYQYTLKLFKFVVVQQVFLTLMSDTNVCRLRK